MQVGDRFLMDGGVFLAAVAVLHDGHAGTFEIQHLLAGFLEDFHRQDCRPGAEIIHS